MAKNGIMTKRIPTLLGVVILIAGLIGGIILVNSRQGGISLESKAGPTSSPKNIKISNLGASTFSISWTTDIPVTGLIKYSQDPNKITTPAGDVRDQISGTSQSYTNHTVNVTGLVASKTYYILIVSGSGSYDDNGKPFQVRTTSQIIAPPEDTIYGKVVSGIGDAVNGAILFVETEGSTTLSTITKNDGTWRLNLANLRDKDGKVVTYDPSKTLVSIFVQAGSDGTATALTDTSKDKPVPDIVLGKNQSFTVGSIASTLDATPAALPDTAKGFQLDVSALQMSEHLEATGSVKILNPASNDEIVATDLPEFRGKAPAGSTLKLTLRSIVELTKVVQADVDGNWSWTPPQRIDQGQHTLTVEYTDAGNQLQKIMRQFSVLVSNQPAFTATPSAVTVTPVITASMPATKSARLTDSGGLMTTIELMILGMGLILFGKVSKKWVK